MKRGLFITIEGPDGSGKSTQSKLLVRYLCRKGWDVVHTREPGGTLFTEFLRKILLKPESRISPLTELLLYTASRAQHTIELIKPALQDNKIVVCERYTDATTAYQGYGRKLIDKLITSTHFLTKHHLFCIYFTDEKGIIYYDRGSGWLR
ncbi:MAG: dTMP kinase [Elusimicrobia bacterium CG1_02_37_114]|nr:MAG: dTMP kinase [Elusimicrobia bacterium CG1_02_37_114]